jgi:EpsD family peptidyl-prolyl cis-trans isomerase
MKKTGAIAFVAITCVSVGACRLPHIPGMSAKAPTGQVVATVDGKEVTFLELQAEMAGVTTTDPKIRKAAEQRALENIIVRKLLADAARQQKLDKTPEFALQEQRGTEGLLAQTLQKKLVSQVPDPSPDEAQRFITDHPDIFAQRKIFAVDVIRMARPSDINILNGLKPLKTLADVDAYLTVNKVPHGRTSGNIDAVGADPRLVDQIVKLPPDEVFLYPADNGFMVDQIRDTKVVPFEGEQATKYALALIKRQRIQESVERGLRQTVANGMRTVQYNPAYKPAAPTAQPATGAQPAPKPAT